MEVYLQPGLIPLTCQSNYKVCSSGNYVFQTFSDYSFYFKYKNTTENELKAQYVQSIDKIQLFKSPILNSIETTIIPFNMKAPMRIYGKDFLNSEKVTVRLFDSSSNSIVLSTSSKIVDDSTVEFTLANIPRDSNVTTPDARVQISYNEFSYTSINNQLSFVENPEITRIENENYRGLPALFSFQETNLTVYGNNFVPPNENVQIRLFNNLVSHTSTFYYFISSQKIIFPAPKLSDFNSSEIFQFPVQIKFHYSLNKGVHGFTFGVYYVDKFTPIILSSASPNVLARKPYQLKVQGIGFDHMSKCEFKVGNSIFATEPITTNDKNTILCDIDNYPGFDSVQLFVTNVFNDSSNAVLIQYFDPPTIISISPLNGISLGGYDLTINGIGFTNKFNSLWVAIGSFNYRNCIFKSDTQIVCKLHAHPAGDSQIKFSYNNIDFIDSPQSIMFKGCEPGYSALNYTISCTPCSEGLYKPTIGFGKW